MSKEKRADQLKSKMREETYKQATKGTRRKGGKRKPYRDSNGTPKAEFDTGAKNDISWYITDPQILNDVARIPYSIPVGYPLTRHGRADTGLSKASFDDAIPGIAAMGLTPTIGNAQHANDAVNVAANGLYTFVRHINSGSRNYDGVDEIIYCMAVDSVYYIVSWATRLYATLSLYAQGNRYLPDALLYAQQVDYTDLRAKMAQFRSGLNQRIRKISTLCVPAVMPIFTRHSWLFSNYYIEGESIKDQIYMYYPRTWYKFMNDSDGAGMLKAYLMQGTRTLGTHAGLIGVQDIFDILDEMIDPIFADEDFNIMSGDILKAYGESNILKLGLIPDELPIGLAYNEEVLLQFKNAKVAEVRSMRNSGQSGIKEYSYYSNMFNTVQSEGKSYVIVTRDPAAIQLARDFNGNTYTPGGSDLGNLLVQACMNEWSKDTLLTSPHADVQPAENMINTRLTLAFHVEYDSSDENPTHVRIEDMYFGSEWPQSLFYYCIHRNRVSGELTVFDRRFTRVMVVSEFETQSPLSAATSFLPIRSAFKFAPEAALIVNETEDTDPDPTVSESGRSLFEVDNYTLCSYEVIGLLHNAAIQGEYNIPRIAMFPTK